MKGFVTAILLAALLMCSVAAAYETENVPIKVIVEKDGAISSFNYSIDIKVAEQIPEVAVLMTACRANKTACEPYAGPYQPGEDVKINVQAWLKNEGTCADRIIVEAPVYDPATEAYEVRKVIDTKAYAPNGACYGPKFGMHWLWKAGLPFLDDDGNPIIGAGISDET